MRTVATEAFAKAVKKNKSVEAWIYSKARKSHSSSALFYRCNLFSLAGTEHFLVRRSFYCIRRSAFEVGSGGGSRFLADLNFWLHLLFQDKRGSRLEALILSN
jgi:hypothetical protein